MKLRDLTSEQLKRLAARGTREYDEWKKTHGITPKTEEQVWQWAFSRGASAVLEMEEK